MLLMEWLAYSVLVAFVAWLVRIYVRTVWICAKHKRGSPLMSNTCFWLHYY